MRNRQRELAGAQVRWLARSSSEAPPAFCLGESQTPVLIEKPTPFSLLPPKNNSSRGSHMIMNSCFVLIPAELNSRVLGDLPELIGYNDFNENFYGKTAGSA